MEQRDYNQLILKRVERSFDYVMLIGGILSIISALILVNSTIPMRFTVSNTIIGLILIVMFFLRKKLEIETKIAISLIMPIFMGVHSFMHGGFGTSAMTLLLISNAVAVLFLDRIKSLTTAAVTILIIGGLYVWAEVTGFDTGVKLTAIVWLMQALTMVLFILLLQMAFYTIRRYLLENIGELEEAVDMTYRLAYYDQLTGLPNRYKFIEEIQNKVDDGPIEGYIVMVRLDNMGMIRSIYSDALGNKILVSASEAFSNLADGSELFSRIDGNEFAFWTETFDERKLQQRLAEFEGHFHRDENIPEVKKRLTYYVSCAKLKKNHSDAEACFHKASLALIYARHNNIRNLVPYNSSFEKLLKHENMLKEKLQDAIVEETMDMHYQALWHVPTGKVIGVESLSRWQVDDEVVSPAIFVPMTEEMGLSVAFGRMTVRKIMSDYETLCQNYGQDLRVSVNISPTFMLSDDFCDFMANTALEHGVSPHDMVLEITEEVLIEGIDRVNAVLEPLRAMGFIISLDDFGSGYSSLNYLTSIAVDELKIDRSFIREVEDNSRTRIMIETIISLGSQYGATLVAEGIETEAQKNILEALGCSVMQGYYFSMPAKLDKVTVCELQQ